MALKQANSVRAERLPRGRHGFTREEVMTSQRRRMLDAMARATGEKGYVNTSVRDVLERAGVSRETFYEHFSDKQDCFIATLGMVQELLVEWLESAASTRAGDPQKRFERVLGAYLDALAAEPLYAHAFLVEAFAAGPEASRQRFAMQDRFVDLVAEQFGAHGKDDRFACELLVAAISSLVTNRVASGRAAELPALRGPIVRFLRTTQLVA